ncbi:MAG: UDP-4-amino-4,6-dideoxy-N-acetyl-beta-L-altrosamine transaminase [Spirochaetes bacterium RBG_13_51_14]|nr:MAG: UDP-4-amino-4,6-dideoxy-N-acetyl-beta-L-altrosamine transaminase [Spirochaetes bacterium RBG_13_51_14]
MKVPFHKPYITDAEILSVTELMRTGWLTAGSRTIDFENEFKGYIGCANAVSVNSATAALHLSLAAIGIQEGDEVLVPAVTFAATAEVVRYFNAWPVFVDVERETHLIDVKKIEEKITGRTRAIIPVHYAGQPCDMDEIRSIARSRRLYVVEDAAHSLPAWYRGMKIGTLGDITCFSFYATKTLTTGEGGMLCTGSTEWARRAAVLRLHGISRDTWERANSGRFWQYDVVEVGYKYNTTDIASAIGIEQLKKLELMWNMRVRIAERYTAAFRDRDELFLYLVKPDRVSSWYLYPLDLNLESLTIGRDQFIEEMRSRGVVLSVHFTPLYEFSYYKNMGYTAAGYDNSRWVYERTMSLPIFPGMTDGEIDYVIESVFDVLKNTKR